MYIIKFTEDGIEDAKKLGKNVKNAIKKEIKDVLAKDPYGCSIELDEPLKGFRSFHICKYRVVFKIYDDLNAIAVVGIGKRLHTSNTDIYERLEALATSGRLAEKVLTVLRGF